MAAYTDSHGFDKGSAGHPAKGLLRVGYMEVTLDFAKITADRATAGATAGAGLARCLCCCVGGAECVSGLLFWHGRELGVEALFEAPRLRQVHLQPREERRPQRP